MATLRQLFRAYCLSRDSLSLASRRSSRRRLCARTAGDLWHADACHVWATTPSGTTRTWRVRAIVDNCSRCAVGLEVFGTETETDLLRVLCKALM